MATSSFLIVQLHGARYGMELSAIIEIFSLPHLLPIAEAPLYVVGVVNLRGRVVPVIDLDQRLGRGLHHPTLPDVVVALRVEGHVFGVIVDEVIEVLDVDAGAMVPVPSYGEERGDRARLIGGIALNDGQIVPVIDLRTLLATSEGIVELESEEPESILALGELVFAPDADAAARSIFRERATALMASPVESVREEQRGLAMFRLGTEYFAVDLEIVQEFAAAPEITPVPCCPPQIVGQINLRGDIVTLVDIRAALEMSVPPPPTSAQALVIGVDELRAGVVVDDVYAVTSVPRSEVTSVPAAARSASREYLVGVVSYRNHMVSVLDLARMFSSGVFHVEEEII